MAKTGEITGKRLRFVQEYCVDQNATQAAVRAGYSPNSARQQGQRLLSNAAIREAIDARVQTIAADVGVTAERIIAEQARVAFAGMSRFLRITADGDPMFDLSACSPEDLDLLGEVIVEDYTEGRGEDARDVRRIKIKPLDKGRALDALAKIMGMYRDKTAEAADRNTDAVRDLIAALTPKGSKAPIAPSIPPRKEGGR